MNAHHHHHHHHHHPRSKQVLPLLCVALTFDPSCGHPRWLNTLKPPRGGVRDGSASGFATTRCPSPRSWPTVTTTHPQGDRGRPPRVRPGSVAEPGPQRSDRSLRHSSGAALPTLGLPVLDGASGEAVGSSALSFLRGRTRRRNGRRSWRIWGRT